MWICFLLKIAVAIPIKKSRKSNVFLMGSCFPELSFSVEELLEMRCYEALRKIKAVLEDESLTDAACFQKIEEIINIFEEIGSDGGSRHDF